MKKRVLVLGCTGSIGKQTIDIVRHFPLDFEICGVAAGKNESEVQVLCDEFNCKGTVFSRDGIKGIENLVKESSADIAVNGISGSGGLIPSLLVLENGIDLALANKETVVMAWQIVKKAAEKSGKNIIPVDSEHSAIFSLIQKISAENISEIIITASGGPFRKLTDEQLENVTVEDALCHPTWTMGPKITVDSASLANKGLEVIEASRLFDFSPDKITVVIHPQSLIHSLVRTKDGVLYAQISKPDMRHPILNALVWPEQKENFLDKLDLASIGEMTFSFPRYDSFPLLAIAFECAKKNASYPIAFNAANEVAVASFLEKKIGFLDISRIVNQTLEKDWTLVPETLEQVLEIDRLSRLEANRFLSLLGGKS